MQNPMPEFLTVAQVAERIGVTEVRVRQMQLSNALPAPDVREGGRKAYRWRPETIGPWLALYDERRGWEAKRGEMLAELTANATDSV